MELQELHTRGRGRVSPSPGKYSAMELGGYEGDDQVAMAIQTFIIPLNKFTVFLFKIKKRQKLFLQLRTVCFFKKVQ